MRTKSTRQQQWQQAWYEWWQKNIKFPCRYHTTTYYLLLPRPQALADRTISLYKQFGEEDGMCARQLAISPPRPISLCAHSENVLSASAWGRGNFLLGCAVRSVWVYFETESSFFDINGIFNAIVISPEYIITRHIKIKTKGCFVFLPWLLKQWNFRNVIPFDWRTKMTENSPHQEQFHFSFILCL